MNMIFTAKFLFSEKSSLSVQAGLADDEFETQAYVLFQRTLNPSAQDCSLGHDAPYFEIGEQAVSGYGGVSRIQFGMDQVVIEFSPPLPKVGAAVVAKVGTHDGLEALENALEEIFGPLFFRSGQSQ